MADTGVKYAGDSTSSGVGVEWINFAGSVGSTEGDSTYITLGGVFGQDSKYLRLTNFSANVPDNSTINGIKVEIREDANNDSLASGAWNDIRILINGVAAGTNKAAAGLTINSTTTNRSLGGASDLWGLTSPTSAQINASNFGVQLRATEVEDRGNESDIFVFWVRVTIYYTEAANPVKKHTMFFAC